MKQLEEYKEELAKERGYDNWEEVLECEAWEIVDALIYRYAINYSLHQQGGL